MNLYGYKEEKRERIDWPVVIAYAACLLFCFGCWYLLWVMLAPIF